MANTISPNMNLVIPTVGSEPGPTYASDVNSSLTLIDQHDHTPGNGVAITPQGLDINSILQFNNNIASGLMGATFLSQASALAINGTLYVNQGDLWYTDYNGAQIPLTVDGSIAGSTGNITGLVPPASAAFSGSTFKFESGTNIAGNLDGRNLILRNSSASSKGLTLLPPSAMAADFSLTLPSKPASTSFMTMDSSGNMSASPTLLGALTTANLSASAGILGTQLAASTISGSNIINQTITASKIALATITNNQIASATIVAGNIALNEITSGLIAPNINLRTNPTVDSVTIAVSPTSGGAGAHAKILHGTFNNSGLLEGSGWTFSRISTGVYNITFSAAYANGTTPVCIANGVSVDGTTAPLATFVANGSNTAQIIKTGTAIGSVSDIPANTAVSFILMGPIT